MSFLKHHKGIRYARNLLMLLLVLVVVYGAGRLLHVYLGSFYSGARAPYLQLPAPDAMTLRWQTPEKGIAEIRYGFVPEQLVYKEREKIPTAGHEIRLSGLRPNSRYYYTISMDGKFLYGGSQSWFETLPAASDNISTRFVVLGDPGYHSNRQIEVRDAISAWLKSRPRNNRSDFDFLLTTGDNAYQSGSNEQFQTGFFTPYTDWLRNIPVWPAYGNHDARRWAFFDIFSLPANAESGGYPSGTEHYYSFNVASVHVVVLDTQASSLARDGAQLAWLIKDLQQNQQAWTVVVSHHPPYTHGSHNSDNKKDSRGRMFYVRENVLPILEQAGVDLVLSGHSHMYERTHLMACHYGTSDTLTAAMQKLPVEQKGDHSVYLKSGNSKPYTGAVYTIVGSSSKLNDGPLDHPANVVSLREAGALIVEVHANRMDVRFISPSVGEVDYFSIEKKKDYPFSFNCK